MEVGPGWLYECLQAPQDGKMGVPYWIELIGHDLREQLLDYAPIVQLVRAGAKTLDSNFKHFGRHSCSCYRESSCGNAIVGAG